MKGRYTMISNNSIGALGFNNYYDWANILNDPYFAMMWQSKNINFKGNESTTSASSSSTNQGSSDNTIPITAPSTAIEKKSDSGWIFPAAALAVTGLGALWAIKSGKFGQAEKCLKSIINRGKSSSLTTETLSRLTAIKQGNEIKFLIPGHTIAKSGTQIDGLVTEYGIKSAINAERQAFNPAFSALESFRVKMGKDTYTIFTKDGYITKIMDEIGDNITTRLTGATADSTDAKMLEKFKNIATEMYKDKDIDRTLFNGVSNIRYSNTFGYDILGMTAEKFGATPKLREFTTLKRFDFKDKEMEKLKLSVNEKVFANNEFFKDGKLIEGVKVSEFSDEIGGNYIGNFEGETLVSIKKPDGSIMAADSAGYENVVKTYQKEIEKLIHRVFVKRDYIPNGAKIVTV